MLKKQLSQGIVQYLFQPQPGRHFGHNIIALINENKVILIDTGYEEHSLQVLKDLDNNGLIIDKIIISHFHHDHINGLKVLPKVPLYGSRFYYVTLDKWIEKQEHKYFTPSILIEKEYRLSFGKHQITMIPFPGHSACGILTNINDEYIHIGDELIFSNNGTPVLPCVDMAIDEPVKEHLQSLTRLKKYMDYILIPSHGSIINGKKEIENDIDNRINYFNRILNNDRKISYEEATKECNCIFLHDEWHSGIYG